jgi:polysaccharide pyruvyl transferase WcaK-like protein
VIEYFIVLPNVEVHLVGHVLSELFPIEDDYAFNIEIKNKYPSIVVAPKFSSPSEAKSYIAGLDFFTGARMHACIAAFSSGVPVVPMAYSRKFNGLFESLGYGMIADLKNDSTEIAFSKLTNGFEARAKLKVNVDKGNVIAQKKLEIYQNYLTCLFKSLVIAKE